METKLSSGKLLVEVRDFQNRGMDKAKVLLKGGSPARETPLKFDSQSARYENTNIQPGEYALTVSSKELESDSRNIQVQAGVNEELFILGQKGMPSYQRGRVRVPFKRPKQLLVSLAGRLKDSGAKAYTTACRKLALQDAEVPDAIDDNMHLVDIPASLSDKQLQNVVATLEEIDFVRSVGEVLERGNEAVTALTRQLTVRFGPEVRDVEVQRIAKQFKLEVVRKLPYVPNAWSMNLDQSPTLSILKVINQLHASPGVLYAEPNLRMALADQAINPTDYLYPEQWHIPIVDLPDAWQTLRDANPGGVSPGDPTDLTFGSTDITIAVLDRGIQSNTAGGVTSAIHPDFNGNLTDGNPKVSQFFDFTNMVTNNDAPPNSHGMGCAGVATALANNPSVVMGINEGVVGAAPNSRLMGLIRPSGGTTQQYADAFIWIAGFNPGWSIDGVNYGPGTVFPGVPANPADLISCSFGWSSGAISGLMSDMIDYVTTYGRGGRGMSIFWAAGNYNSNTAPVVFSTALHPKVFAVGASTLANDGVTEAKSGYSAIGNAIEFCAPSHDAYVGGSITHNPPANYGVISAELLNSGEMPGHPANQTNSTAAAGPSAGATSINVTSSAGFAVGQAALIGVPGAVGTEAHVVSGIPNATQIQVGLLYNNHPAATVISAGPANYTNVFGGTSSATPLSAGIAALCLSVNPTLNWVELRQILRSTAVQIDLANATVTGQWVDTTGDGVVNFSQWYGWGRLDADAAVQAARDYDADVDIVIRDNLADVGAVPSGGWHAASPDIWADPNNVAIPALAYAAAPPHVTPIRGQDNYLFVRVKNIGTVASSDIYVRALIVHFPGFEFRYPQEWTPSNLPGTAVPNPLVPGSYLIDEVNIPSLNAGADTILKMTWDQNLVPDATVMVGGMNVNWHPCLLAEASPHDGPLPSGTTFAVKDYNNLAHRNISIDDPDASDSDAATAVVAGTSDAAGIRAIVVDRSLIPSDYRVFVRIADEKKMRVWIDAIKRGRIRVTPSLVSSHPTATGPDPYLPGFDKPPTDGECAILTTEDTRLIVSCCGGKSLIIDAPAKTRLQTICNEEDDARPKLSIGRVQNQEVIIFDHSVHAIELPTALFSAEFVPVIAGMIRADDRRGNGVLRLNQLRGDGQLSDGYEVRG